MFVMFHATLLKIYADDTSMHGSRVFCCPGAAHAIPSACYEGKLWM